MKVAIVSNMINPVPAFKGGAVERLTQDLVENNEKEKKFDIDLYTVFCDELLTFKYQNSNLIYKKLNIIFKIIQKLINFICRKFKINFILNFEWEYVANKISKTKYDYIIVENNMFMYKKIYKKYKYKEKTKFIYHMHNDINKIDKTPENYIFIENTTSKILVVSEFLRNRLNKIKKSNKIEVLYNCIELNNFKRKIDSSQKEEYIHKYNIDTNKVIFMYVGRFSKEKGVLELVKSYNLKNRKNSILILVGEELNNGNKYHLEIMNEIRKNEQNNIINIGNIHYDNLAEIYSIADIVVIPTICEEAFGMVAIESMAMRKKIIATNSGGMTEVLKNNVKFLINISDIINELSKAIDEIAMYKDAKKAENYNVNWRDYSNDNYLNNFILKGNIKNEI